MIVTPHPLLKIVIEDSSPVQMIEAECSCVAGTALCNHNVALLYQTAHYSQLNLAAVPPVLSCTETEQRWHKPRIMVSLWAQQNHIWARISCSTEQSLSTLLETSATIIWCMAASQCTNLQIQDSSVNVHITSCMIFCIALLPDDCLIW